MTGERASEEGMAREEPEERREWKSEREARRGWTDRGQRDGESGSENESVCERVSEGGRQLLIIQNKTNTYVSDSVRRAMRIIDVCMIQFCSFTLPPLHRLF